MLADGVLSSVSRSCVQFSNALTCQRACLTWLVRGQKIKNTKGGKEKTKFFLGGRKAHSFCKLWSAGGLVAVCKMCVLLRVDVLTYKLNILLG